MRLKAAGVTVIRSDHAGKDMSRGQRGSSSKNDDVDIVWQIQRTGDDWRLRRTHSRLTWVDEEVCLHTLRDPLRREIVSASWAPGTMEVVQMLNDLGMPLEVSFREARRLLKEAGKTARNDALGSALRWRREEASGAMNLI